VLLRFAPHLDLVSAEWQQDGPWLLVTLGQASDDGAERFARHHYAIWKATGAVHGVNPGGDVTDDPVMRP
jgi:hypothetical protein